MSYSKRIACLAKSKKMRATCVAGLEWDGKARGDWVRPVGDRESEAIEDEEMEYESGGHLELLDVVDIEFERPKPHSCQVENHLIAADEWWIKAGTVDVRELSSMTDSPADIWGTDNTHHYYRDRIPVAEADGFGHLNRPGFPGGSISWENGVHGKQKPVLTGSPRSGRANGAHPRGRA